MLLGDLELPLEALSLFRCVVLRPLKGGVRSISARPLRLPPHACRAVVDDQPQTGETCRPQSRLEKGHVKRVIARDGFYGLCTSPKPGYQFWRNCNGDARLELDTRCRGKWAASCPATHTATPEDDGDDDADD